MNSKSWLGTIVGLLGLAVWTTHIQAQNEDISEFDVYKGVRYVQTTNSIQLQATPYLFIAEAEPYLAIDQVTITPPGGTAINLTQNEDGNWSYMESAASVSALNDRFGAGDYTFNYNGTINPSDSYTITLGTDNYPNAPQVTNLGQLNALDPDDLFELQWAPFVGGTEEDVIQLIIQENDGAIIFQTPPPDDPEALYGTETYIELPIGTFFPNANYTAILTFYKLTQSDNFETPFIDTGYYSETTIVFQTGDVIPNSTPQLVFSVPDDKAEGVNPSGTVPVVFEFSDAMQPQVSIQWSAGIDPNGFKYEWSANKTTLSCYYTNGFPTNTVITWTLNPEAFNANNFKDTEGDELPVAAYQGRFATSSGTLSAPMISSVKVNASHEVELEVTCAASRSLVIRSSTDLLQWNDVVTTNATSSKVTIKLPVSTDAKVSFFRARQD
jgi:hypothetical protein